MTTSDSDRLLAAGVPVRVAGGERRLRFNLLAFKVLEDAYGNIGAVEDKLHDLGRAMSGPTIASITQPIMADIVIFLSAALDLGAAQVLEGFEGDPGSALMSIVAAWNEAWPSVESGKAEAAKADVTSLGPTSTSPPPSDGIEPTSSSGL